MNPILFPASASGLTPFFASLAVTTLIQYLIYVGAILLVAGAVMIWAVAFRKKPKTRRYRYHRHQSTRGDSKSASDSGPEKSERRRRSEPRRNPTLAETRGLPPVRGEESSSTEHYQH